MGLEGNSSATIIFSEVNEAPLIKNTGFFVSAYSVPDKIIRALDIAEELNIESLHLELGMGVERTCWNHLVTERNSELIFDFSDLDRVLLAAEKHNIQICLSYAYSPDFLQTGGMRAYRNMPKDLKMWGEILKTMAEHFRTEGLPVAYHEIWNVIDDPNHILFSGDWQDYRELFKVSAEAIRSGDPDAVIVGVPTMDAEHSENELCSFYSDFDNSPFSPEIFPIQYYGNRHSQQLRAVRRILQQNPSYRYMPVHIDQTNTMKAPWDYDGTCGHFMIASDMLRLFNDLSGENDIEVVDWAQLLESGMDALGVISDDGKKKASFNAIQIWSRMPADRAIFRSENLHGTASFSDNRASVVIWNDRVRDRQISLDLVRLPSDRGTIKVYKIDWENSSFRDNGQEELNCTETIPVSGQNYYLWSGLLGARGVVYLEFNAEQPAEEYTGCDTARIHFIRTHHCYTDRGGTSYARFDRRTWTARLGSGDQAEEVCMVGAEADFDRDSTLRVRVKGNGGKACGMFSLRMDFRGERGYETAVVWGMDEGVLHWGTQRAADRKLSFLNARDGGFDLDIQLSHLAPDDWDGRAIITFILNRSLPDSRCKVVIEA